MFRSLALLLLWCLGCSSVAWSAEAPETSWPEDDVIDLSEAWTPDRPVLPEGQGAEGWGHAYRKKGGALRLDALPGRAAAELRFSLVGMAVYPTMAVPALTLGWLYSTMGSSPHRAWEWGVMGTLTAGSLATRWGVPAVQLASTRRLRRDHGVSIGGVLPILSLVMAGVETGVAVGTLSSYRPGYAWLTLASMVAQYPLWILQHIRLQRGWTLAVERGRVQDTPHRRSVVVAPLLDPVNRRIGVTGVF